MFLVSSCGDSVPLESGIIAIEIPQDKRGVLLKDELVKKNIAFSTFEYDGKEFVQYPKHLDQIVNDLRAEIDGFAPDGYEGYCPSDVTRITNLLSEHGIEFISRTIFATNSQCIYWPEHADTKVKALDPIYAALMEADTTRRQSLGERN